MAQLELIGVSREFSLEDARIPAVREVSLSINKGEFLSIVGHSGSGKTTLLSIIGGILSPSAGKVVLSGKDVYSLDDDRLAEYRAMHVGYVFQFASLMPVLNVTENLLLPTLFRPGHKTDAKDLERALNYLSLVGLADKHKAYPSQLSGGQQRRVAIARALMNEPELLLADEPTGDLDEETEAEVMGLFKRLNKEQGLTFILVTHNLDLAAKADRRFRMTHGKIEELKN